MYTNDLPSVTKYCKVHLYADDTLSFFESSSVQAIEAALSQNLGHIVGWLNQNYLMLNHSKTKVMLMGIYQKLSSVQHVTKISKGYTNLNIWVWFCLTWDEHIEHIGNKISSILGMIRRAREDIPDEACITLFNAMVLPLFDYCCCVRDGCGQENKNYLDRLLKRAAGIIAGRQATDTGHPYNAAENTTSAYISIGASMIAWLQHIY